MEIGFREWLMVIGGLLILGVLLDGVRRVRNARRNAIRMSLGMGGGFKDDDESGYGSELPNGGARIVNSDRQPGDELNDPLIDNFQATDLQLDESVPVLMNSVGLDETETDQVDNSERIEPVLDPDPLMADAPDVMDAPSAPEAQVVEPTVASAAPRATAKQADLGFETAEEVIVVNVLSRSEEGFAGAELLRIILACGLRFGEMDIFHRHEYDNGEGPVQFSMANAVKPGSFDLNNMEQFRTPGVTFFLSLPGPDDSMKAFDYMHETAQCIAKNLDGELKDEMRSIMTSQTIEHCRQRIADFERRQLTMSV